MPSRIAQSAFPISLWASCESLPAPEVRMKNRSILAFRLCNKIGCFQLTIVFMLAASSLPGRIDNSSCIPPATASISVLLRRADLMLEQGNPSGAVQLCTEILVLDRRYCPAYLRRGVARMQLKDFIGAIDDFVKAV